VATWLGQVKWAVGVVVMLAVPVAYILYKRRQRAIFLRDHEMSRITAEELLERIKAGEELTIVDLRHPLDFLPDPRTLPGALRISPKDLPAAKLAADREVILYCT